MKKTLIALLLISIALASTLIINPSHASTTATLGIDSSTQSFLSAKVGETIQVNLEISNVQDLWAWDIEELTWNSQILNLTSATEGPFLQKEGQTMFLYPSASVVPIANGNIPEISDTLMELSSVSGTGDIVSLNFIVVSTGTCNINFGEVIAYAPPPDLANPDEQTSIAITAVNGTVTVGTPISSTTTTSTPTPTPTSTNSRDSGSQTSTGDIATPTPDGTLNIPEFSAASTVALLAMFVATASLLLIVRKRFSKK